MRTTLIEESCFRNVYSDKKTTPEEEKNILYGNACSVELYWELRTKDVHNVSKDDDCCKEVKSIYLNIKIPLDNYGDVFQSFRIDKKTLVKMIEWLNNALGKNEDDIRF